MISDIIGGGETAEDRFERLLSNRNLVPAWIVLVMRANPEDDKEKNVDFYIATSDDKTIMVDVKSSREGMKKYVRKRGSSDVCLVVMEKKLDDVRMLAKIIQVLELWKKTRLP